MGYVEKSMSRSKTSPKPKAAAPKAKASSPRLAPPRMGCDLLVDSLEKVGVDTIFAYPGGASMMLHQSLTRSKQIRTILPRHEQGGVFMAEGYARATGKAGVVMATSGPGATNLVTGIADAFMDSVPLVAITGQVPTTAIGRGAFQETDVFGLTLPIVKHSYLVMHPGDIPRIVAEAFHIATTGRPGPVVIDIPKDVQKATAQTSWPPALDIPGYRTPPAADEHALHEILGLIDKAERPVLYVGGGIITSGAAEELQKFARTTGIPVATTLMGIGCFPENDPQSLKWLGMHGTVYANTISLIITQETRRATRPLWGVLVLCPASVCDSGLKGRFPIAQSAALGPGPQKTSPFFRVFRAFRGSKSPDPSPFIRPIRVIRGWHIPPTHLRFSVSFRGKKNTTLPTPRDHRAPARCRPAQTCGSAGASPSQMAFFRVFRGSKPPLRFSASFCDLQRQ